MIRSLKIITLFLPVVLGGLIYIIFRTERLLMFHWFGYLKLSDEINLIKNLRNIYSFPCWFIYSLPDGLWVFSYTALSLEIWKLSITRHSFFWIFSIPVMAVLSEFLQLFKIIPGTFDLIDVMFYLLGIILSFYKILNTKIYETL